MSRCSAASRREAPPSTRAITRERTSGEYALGMVRPPKDESIRGDSPICRPLGILRFYSAGTCSSEHVGGAAPGEIASHELGGNRNSRAHKFVGGSRCGDVFAVDQHAVAIKDDHGSLTPACLRHGIGFVLFNESRRKQ